MDPHLNIVIKTAALAVAGLIAAPVAYQPLVATAPLAQSAQATAPQNATTTLVALHRYFAPSTHDHMSLTRALTAEEKTIYTVDRVQGYISKTQVPGTVALYACRQNGHPYNSISTLSANCNGHIMQELVGYVWTEPGQGRIGLHRCHRTAGWSDHYLQKNCQEGHKESPQPQFYVMEDPTASLPSCALDANPSTIIRGATSTLSWITDDAVSGTINRSVGAMTPILGGSKEVTPVVNTTYTATVRNSAGRAATCTATVTVTAAPPEFQEGDTVVATERVVVRTTPSTSGSRRGAQPEGKRGVITAGPTVANNFVWYRVNWEGSTVDGWSVQNFLDETTPGADTTPPTVSITAPDAGATVSGTVNVRASASDNVGVTKVEFKVGDITKGEDTTSSYAYNWNASSETNGTKTLNVVAVDAAGNRATSTRTVTVNNSSQNCTLDGVTVPNGESRTFYSSRTVTPPATCASISQSRTCTNGNLSGSNTYQYRNCSATSDTTAPTVSITAPAAGATVSGTSNITASASDAGGIEKVEFKLGQTTLGSDTTSPYSYSWNTAATSNGSKTIHVVAEDEAGNRATSTRQVTVQNSGAAAPTASPAAGTYSSAQSVTLTASGASAIRYTTTGTDPTCTTGTVYSAAIAVPSTLTIKAVACYGSTSSSVATFAYTINTNTSCSASASSFSAEQGRAVQFTWDGSQTEEFDDVELPDAVFSNIDTAAEYHRHHTLAAAAPAAGRTAATNGNWSDPATWGGSVPGPSDDVVIPAGRTITIDTDARAATLEVRGTLRVAEVNASLTARWVMVMGANARFIVGTESNPHTSGFTLTLTGSNVSENIHGAGTKFLMAMDGGEIQMHGKPKVSWTKLARTVLQGASTITLTDAVNWNVGDEIVIASSVAPDTVDPALATEVRTITALSADCKTLTLNQPLNYRHVGVVKTYSNGARTWTLDERAEVGLLTRNIKVQGDAASSASGLGGHIMIMRGPVGNEAPGKGYFSNVEITRMGQRPQGCTAFRTGCTLTGMGRYPIHWHLLQAAGDGQYIKNSSIHRTFNRALTVHGTDKLLIERNVMFDHPGHGVFLEDGGERFNKFYYNLVLLTRRVEPRFALLPSDFEMNQVQNRTPSMFWITNPNNEFVGNVAAGTLGTSYWFALPYTPHGPSKTIPYYANIVPINQPLGEFRGNVSHSARTGIDIHDSIKDGSEAIDKNQAWNPPTDETLEDFTVYANNLGIYSGTNGPGQYREKITFRNVVSADHRAEHVRFANYDTIRNSLFVADSGNAIMRPSHRPALWAIYDGPGRLYDSHIVGFNTPSAMFIKNGGAAQKRANHIFGGLTFDPVAQPHIRAEDCSVAPFCQTGPNNNLWTTTLRDLTGSITGVVDSTITTGHPLVRTSTDTPYPNGNMYVSRRHFAALKMLSPSGAPNVRYVRSGGGEPSVTFTDTSVKAHPSRIPHLIVNDGFLYDITFLQPRSFTLSTSDGRAGDSLLVRFMSSDGVSASPPAGWTQRTSEQALRTATTDSYYVDSSNNLWLKIIFNTAEDRNEKQISWSGGFSAAETRTTTDAPTQAAPPEDAGGEVGHTHSTFCTLTRNLARGAAGDDVLCLQHFLQHQGLLTEADIIGTYGPRTERAVAQWQAQQGIVQSGEAGYGNVGPRTRAALNIAMNPAISLEEVPEMRSQLASALSALEGVVEDILSFLTGPSDR